MRPHLIRPLLVALLTTVLLVGAAACGDDEDPEATGSGDTTEDTTGDTTSDPNPDYGSPIGGSTDGTAAEKGTIIAKDFELSDLTVAPGEEIVLKNEGGAKHTATADDDGGFNLEADGGATSDPDTAPEEPGSYDFHCEIHSTMTATLTVEG